MNNFTSLATQPNPKLVVRAVMRCKDPEFQMFLEPDHTIACEDVAIKHLRKQCGIKSRSELAGNEAAQEKFMDLEREFYNFKNPIDEIYKENFERME